MQQEMLVILYPVFVHCYLDLVAKGHSEEGWFIYSLYCAHYMILMINST